MKTGLFFFVADHLLFGQLCTNPKSDRSILSCLKVTQSSMREIGDASLYNSCSLPIQVMTTGPLPAPSKYKSGLPRITGWWKQSFRLRLWSLVWFQVRAILTLVSCVKICLVCLGIIYNLDKISYAVKVLYIMPPHIFEVSLKVKTKVYLDVLKSVVIPWCNQVASGRPWVWQQDSAPAHKSKETQAWLQKERYDSVPFSHWPPSSSNLNLLDYFVWSYVKIITNMSSHNTKTSLITTTRRVFAELPPALVEKACSKFRIHIEAVIEAESGYIE